MMITAYDAAIKQVLIPAFVQVRKYQHQFKTFCLYTPSDLPTKTNLFKINEYMDDNDSIPTFAFIFFTRTRDTKITL